MSTTLPDALPINSESKEDRFDLVEMLLAEQQSMTAIERFSKLHDEHDEPVQARYYRDLLPATPPREGTQYAFRVDLDSCSGCKACVVACHNLNGLEENETWRRVGTLTIGDDTHSRVQHVTTTCHHCDDPGCLNGCPVKAYDKDPDTGIVRHLDDQCIGCKYCTMMCPYEVPQYSKRLGIVRKCDMCHQRLSTGEAPACVQSCPNEAISIRLVDMTGTSFNPHDALVSGAPLSTLTRPSTEYASRHTDGDARSQDHGIDQAGESHWPLAVMLVATQISVGMLLAERLVACLLWLSGSEVPIVATQLNTAGALIVGLAGLAIAPLHLGQPLRAWRVFLGLRTSWLSREAIVLGKYVGVLATAVALFWLPTYANYLPRTLSERIPPWLASAVLGIAILLGIAGLISSAMIYIATRRRLWRHERTFKRFLGTAIVGGLACTLPAISHAAAPMWTIVVTLLLASAMAIGKCAWEWQVYLGPPAENDDTYDHRSRSLVASPLRQWRNARIAFGGASSLLLLIAIVVAPWATPVPFSALLVSAIVLLVSGELCERLLYFQSVVFDRMPGTLR